MSRRGWLLLPVLAVFLVAGCTLAHGAEERDAGLDAAALDAPIDARFLRRDAFYEPDVPPFDASRDAPSRACTATCEVDLDCERSCPPSVFGAMCCDPTTSVCYASSLPVCPGPFDAGFCPATCTSDEDCAACGDGGGGPFTTVGCCDRVTSTCFLSDVVCETIDGGG